MGIRNDRYLNPGFQSYVLRTLPLSYLAIPFDSLYMGIARINSFNYQDSRYPD